MNNTAERIAIAIMAAIILALIVLSIRTESKLNAAQRAEHLEWRLLRHIYQEDHDAWWEEYSGQELDAFNESMSYERRDAFYGKVYEQKSQPKKMNNIVELPMLGQM